MAADVIVDFKSSSGGKDDNLSKKFKGGKDGMEKPSKLPKKKEKE